ncbi:metallophosphoesterase family protein [uncultured Roseobacter sp.]|uniref:metallophosphoesterase family protein n=1 Tax=uncultured Roseobacter sp. TaxID=114847 RepID=UPI00261BFA49|nr:metallophosphoesterase family protein [uncultured Roseobacter sp.]
MHRDLGIINGPVLLFGGPYSNLHALQALIADADRFQIRGHHMICTGDVVAYCGAPAQTVDTIRQMGASVVAGNCEKQLAENAPDCGCGFDADSACDLLSQGWYPFANARVDPKARRWMGHCPDILSFRHQGARYAVIHGGWTEIARFIWPNSSNAVFEMEWCAIESSIGAVDHVIAGHCGLAFVKETPQGRWINPGVIGMPPNDGRQQTRYGILDGGEVQIHRLSYDAEAAAAAMRAAGLTGGYEAALLSGYWPSEDILPVSLRGPSLANG